jgi:hypothetical protein
VTCKDRPKLAYIRPCVKTFAELTLCSPRLESTREGMTVVTATYAPDGDLTPDSTDLPVPTYL